MANQLNDYERRTTRDKGLEETQGVAVDGFYDPNGEYPTHLYKGVTSINKAALGQEIHELAIGGGDANGAIDLPPLKQSVYPHSQVKATASGHIIEYDDTPGNERILIKHRTGSGIECRADGSVVVASVKNRVEVVGGTETVIVEGDGNLVYKGNLSLDVTGDFNLNVAGSYNVSVGGAKTETINHSSTTTIIQDETVTVKGSSTKDIGVNDTRRVRNNSSLTVSEGLTIDSKTINQAHGSGAIGGSSVDFTGATYTGSTFHGDLNGNANWAAEAFTANTASSLGGGGVDSADVNVVGSAYSPSLDYVLSTLDTTYSGVTNAPLTTDNARSMLRSPANASNSTLTSALVEAGIISSGFASTTVPDTNRRESAGSSFKGTDPIGSNPPTITVKSVVL